MIASPRKGGKLALFLVFLALQSAVFAQTVQERAALITSALRNREFDHALELLGGAIDAFPNNPQFRMFEGLAYMGKGDPNAALASYQAALKISPDYLPALEGAAQLEYEQGRPEAVPLLEHVLRLRPQDPTSHAMLAVLAYKKGDCASAAKHFAESGPALHS